MHRQIGNGESVRVWRDKWLPTPFTYRVGSPQRLSNSDFGENELIDQNMGQWNTNLIHQLFLSYEVDTILSIPISSRLLVDKKIWAGTANGHFNVRSAYKVAVEMAMKHIGSCSEGTTYGFFGRRYHIKYNIFLGGHVVIFCLPKAT